MFYILTIEGLCINHPPPSPWTKSFDHHRRRPTKLFVKSLLFSNRKPSRGIRCFRGILFFSSFPSVSLYTIIITNCLSHSDALSVSLSICLSLTVSIILNRATTYGLRRHRPYTDFQRLRNIIMCTHAHQYLYNLIHNINIIMRRSYKNVNSPPSRKFA